MTITQPNLTIKQLLSNITTKLPVAKIFKLTAVEERPKRTATSKMIRLSFYDLYKEVNPQLEFNRIRKHLKLANLSIKPHAIAQESPLTAHTLHMHIPLDELINCPNYAELLAAIGYKAVISKGNNQLFVNNSKPNSQPSFKPNINVIDTSQGDPQEILLFHDLFYRHPGLKTYQSKLFDTSQKTRNCILPKLPVIEPSPSSFRDYPP